MKIIDIDNISKKINTLHKKLREKGFTIKNNSLYKGKTRLITFEYASSENVNCCGIEEIGKFSLSSILATWHNTKDITSNLYLFLQIILLEVQLEHINSEVPEEYTDDDEIGGKRMILLTTIKTDSIRNPCQYLEKALNELQKGGYYTSATSFENANSGNIVTLWYSSYDK